MKKKFVSPVILMCILNLGLVLGSCDNGTLDGIGSTNNSGNSIVGVWESTMFENFTLTFKSNKTFDFSESGFVIGSGTYEVDGSRIWLVYDDGAEWATIVDNNKINFGGIPFTRKR